MAEPLIIDLNSSEKTNLISTMDMDVYGTVQPLLNQLYNSKYGDFWSYVIAGIPVANLVGAFFVFGLFLLFRKLFTKFILEFFLFLAKKSKTSLDEQIIMGLKESVRFGFVVMGLHAFFLLIFVSNDFIHLLLESLIILTIFWALISIIDAVKDYMFNYRNIDKQHSRELTAFIIKVIKGIVIAIGLSIILHNWGINVTGLVASLGLGGLAFALAAKDTAANLFASIAILLDNSIKSGEWIKVAGVEGVVIGVGMRTTKIRSFQKSLFTVPNHLIANNPIENFSRRGVRRIKINVGLTYDTSSPQLGKIVLEIREMLQSHPKISQKETLLVNFNDFGDSALNIFIYAFTRTSQWDHYLDIREDIHLKIIQIVENNNSAFAFPSQSLYMETLPMIDKK
ncbi:MAG: mechanosensitive ion channel family protein [Epsilonproteobacteria bacterium]|nr:MAG: mechanosensitive ion channel family protein [Campylobacterota bacterium]